jgi:spore germination protein KC
MTRRSMALFLYFAVAATLVGCWDRRELNDLAIAVGIGLDRSDNGIEVTTQIVNPSEVASKKAGTGYSTPVTSFSATELTTFEALRKLTTIAPRRIFPSHLRVLVIGESLARQGLMNVLDGISRDRDFRSDFYLIIAKGTSARKVLEILTPIEQIPANKMFVTLDMSQKFWAPTVKMQLDQFMSDLADPAKDTVLTGIEIAGNQEMGKTIRNLSKAEPIALLKYTGVALFNDDKLTDWLNEDESKGYNFIMGNVKNTAGHLTCPGGGNLAVEGTRTKSKIKGKVVEGKPEISIQFSIEQNIGEVQCKIDLTKSENINLIEELAKEKLTKVMEAAVHKAQDNKADIFGFGEAIEDANPKYWLKIRKDWDKYFADLKVTFNVDVQIRRLGTTNNSIVIRKE